VFACNQISFLQGTRSLQRVKYIIKELYKRETKCLCKVFLKSHRNDAVDTDRLHEFKQMLREAEIPANVDAISSNEEEGPSNNPATDIGGSSMQV
jgi:hypothetical protein